MGKESVVGVVQIQRRQLLDAVHPVGDRVRVHPEQAGGLLEAGVLIEVDRQCPDEIQLVGRVVLDQRSEDVVGELPQLVQVADLQEQPVDPQVVVGDDLAGTADPDPEVDGMLGLLHGPWRQIRALGGLAQA